MNVEPKSIAKRDWRLQAITTLAQDFKSPWTGNTHPAGSPVSATAFAKQRGSLFQFALPNAPAMYLSMANRALESGTQLLGTALSTVQKRSVEGTLMLPESAEQAILDAIENSAAGVIFAYLALEAFANEAIPDNHEYSRSREDGRYTEVYSRNQIERWLSLDAKLHEVLPPIFHVRSPKGTKTWQRYVWLKELRDRLVHLKSSDWRTSGPELADGILWTKLMHKDVAGAAAIAARMIAHFTKGHDPRWLRKLPFSMKD